MDAALGSLLDRLQGFVSKNLFLTGFLPIAAFLSLDILLTIAFFPSSRNVITALFALDLTEQAVTWAMIFLLVFVAGLVISSLNPWMKQLLEGYYLPETLRKRLVRNQRNELHNLKQRRKTRVPELAQYGRAYQTWPKELAEARRKGEIKQRFANNEPEDTTLSEELEICKKRVSDLYNQNEYIPFSEMQQLFNKLEKEMRAKPASKIHKLDQLHVNFREDWLEYALEEIEMFETTWWTERRLRFPQNTHNLGPTQLANVAEVHREYGLQRYGLDVELFWLRLLKIVKADKEFYPILEDAKTQLDFSVAISVLLMVHTFFWPALFWSALFLLGVPTLSPYLLILLIAAVSLIGAWAFYGIAVQNYRSFGEAVRSAIDLYRFELLKALHVSLPKDSREEKELWEQLATWTSQEGGNPILYVHEETQKTTNEVDAG